jgi:hypothetical protein
MSNENAARKHMEDAEAWAITKRREIYQWAEEWVNCNPERVQLTPLEVSMYDALDLVEKGNYLGSLAPDELDMAKVSLKSKDYPIQAITNSLII